MRKNEDRNQSMLDKYRAEINALRMELEMQQQQQQQQVVSSSSNVGGVEEETNDIVEIVVPEGEMRVVIDELEVTKEKLEIEKMEHLKDAARMHDLKLRLASMQTALFNSKMDVGSESGGGGGGSSSSGGSSSGGGGGGSGGRSRAATARGGGLRSTFHQGGSGSGGSRGGGSRGGGTSPAVKNRRRSL